MSNSQNATSKCFSGIIRRLLCTGSLPTHPSDLITEPNHTTNSDHLPNKDLKTEVNPQAQVSQVTPGIVARLMGLDSFPDFNFSPKERTLDSILRSRSVNSVNYFPEFDLNHALHRRVRTSVSFREVPTFLQQENQDFFVFCFDKVCGSGKSGMALEDLKQNVTETEKKRERKNEKKENQENKNVCKRKDEPNKVYGKGSSKVDSVHLLSKKKVVQRQPHETMKTKSAVKKEKITDQSKIRSKKQSRCYKAKKVQPMRDSENSSPVLVLDDLHNILSDHEITTATTTSGDLRTRGSNSRRKSASNVANNNHSSSNSTRIFIVDEPVLRAKRNNKDDKPIKKTREVQYYAELLSEISRLTEKDIKESKWPAEKVSNFEDIEEICTEFGKQILEQLFQQALAELVGCNLKNLSNFE